mgnify:CR=1 FL=1
MLFAWILMIEMALKWQFQSKFRDNFNEITFKTTETSKSLKFTNFESKVLVFGGIKGFYQLLLQLGDVDTLLKAKFM